MASPLTRQRPRSCVACRTEAPKRALIRIARAPSGDAVLDVTGKLPGRGAYICLNPECLSKARKSGALERALKASLSKECWEELERCVGHYAEGQAPQERLREARALIGLSRRARLCLIGADGIRAEGKGRALLLLTAQDSSDSVLKFATDLAADERHCHIRLPLDVEALSGALGTGGVQIVALPARNGLADKLKALLDNMTSDFKKGGCALEQQSTDLRPGEEAE